MSEQLLKEILSELKNLNQRVGNFEEARQQLIKGQEKLEASQQHLKEELKNDIKQIDSKIDKLELRIENEIIEKIRALYDARSVQEDINTRIIDTLYRIEAKLDVLQMETAHIRRVRRNRSI